MESYCENTEKKQLRFQYDPKIVIAFHFNRYLPSDFIYDLLPRVVPIMLLKLKIPRKTRQTMPRKNDNL